MIGVSRGEILSAPISRIVFPIATMFVRFRLSVIVWLSTLSGPGARA
jgi:hypothetical protein